MFKNKDVLKSLAIAALFWIGVLAILKSSQIELLTPATWIAIPIALGLIYVLVRCRLYFINLEKDKIDQNWLSRLNNDSISESMAALSQTKPIEPMADQIDVNLIIQSLPPELCFNPIEYCKNNLAGAHLQLFEEVLATMTHPNNQCGAYFERDNLPELIEQQIAKLQKQLLVANGAHRPTLKLEIDRLMKQQFRRNHDNRSLLQHSILVLACAIYIKTLGGDPLTKSSFTRRRIEFTNDDFDNTDPLILICAFAHDIGKITASKTSSMSLEDHARQGQQIVAHLPSYLDSAISLEDRFVLDNVLRHYHTPDSACVGHRIDLSQKTHLYSLSNRMHRALEIVIAADTLAGSIESAASTLRSAHKGQKPFAVKPIEEQEWLTLIGDSTLTNPQSFTPQMTTDLGELAQEVVSAFHEIICEPDSLINPKSRDLENGLGFFQIDIETLSPLLFIKADTMIGLIKAKLGELPNNAFEFVLMSLAENAAISHPFASNVTQYKNTWAWFVDLYPHDLIVRKNAEKLLVLNGEYLRTNPAPVAQIGPMFMVRLDLAPEQYDLRFKGYGQKPWAQYGLIVKGLGSGTTSAWDKFSTELIADRGRIINGESIAKKTDAQIEELTPKPIPEPKAKKKPAAKESAPITEVISIEDFFTEPEPKPTSKVTPEIDKSSQKIGDIMRALIVSGALGKGASSDLLAISKAGLLIADLTKLNENDRRHYGFEIHGDQIRVLRR